MSRVKAAQCRVLKPDHGEKGIPTGVGWQRRRETGYMGGCIEDNGNQIARCWKREFLIQYRKGKR